MSDATAQGLNLGPLDPKTKALPVDQLAGENETRFRRT